MNLIDSSLNTIKQLKYFSKENAQCQAVGSANANPDHLEKMIQLVRLKNITAAKLNIFEQSEHHFTAFLKNRNNSVGCVLSNSLSYLQFLLAQNPFRTTPTSDSALIRYRHTSTKFVHSCVIQTKSNKFKQSQTNLKGFISFGLKII